ncbi:MAG: hypothetical protein SOY73_00015 [Blautia sp.]|nr:hypothetical protein [Blautia sp.]MDY3997498.1 hypothetical protein [Blautia sp.]
MVRINEKQMQQALDIQYKKGVEDGIKLMKQRMLLACENGTPIEIGGRAFFVRGDLQNLRDIMDDLEKGV